jgi:hypothetical protein
LAHLARGYSRNAPHYRGVLVDDDDAKDGGSDEGEVEELNIVLGDFSIQNNIDEQEDSNYEFQRMRSIGEFD